MKECLCRQMVCFVNPMLLLSDSPRLDLDLFFSFLLIFFYGCDICTCLFVYMCTQVQGNTCPWGLEIGVGCLLVSPSASCFEAGSQLNLESIISASYPAPAIYLSPSPQDWGYRCMRPLPDFV